ncbi:MAG: hypothetical protein ACKV19_22435 [Verrucomicrobiales bacterium]
MPPPSPVESDETRERARRRGVVSAVILVAVVVHGVGLVIAAVVVVARIFSEPEATFEVAKEYRIPVKTREHRMAMARHEAVAPRPTFSDRLVSLRPTPFALPEMPVLDLNQILPLDASGLVSDHVGSLVGSAGWGSGLGSGGLGGGGTGGKGFSFLGIETEGARIVLLFDVSTSVLNKANASGLPLAKIKTETLALIKALPLNARYSIVQFVRNYKPFSEQLVPVTPPNRERAAQWIETEWNETGMLGARAKGVRTANPNGLPIVLEFAFNLKPDTVFLISDGSFEQTAPGNPNRSIPDEEIQAHLKRLQQTAGREVPIHFIGFQMKEGHRTLWRRIAQRSGGKFREIK